MAGQTTLEKQVEQLIEQVNTLTFRVFILEQNASQDSPAASSTTPRATQPAGPAPATDYTGTSLLPKIASVCFLLVIALGLRTLTDSGLLDLQLGALLGILYAASLIVSSWGLYGKDSSLAPVFNFCGTLLMFSVALETYVHFEAFPKEVAYLIFAMTGIVLATISHVQQVATPILTGTLGMCLAGIAIDFPNPNFSYLAMLLWLANILGFIASRIKHCSWLRWLLLGVTLTMLQTWSLRITLAPVRGELLAALAPGWLLPMAALISATLLIIALFGILRSGEQRISKFDFSLPTVNACYGILVGLYVFQGSSIFGLLLTAIALLHFAIAYTLSRRKLKNAPGTNAFTLAGTILLAFALPSLFGTVLPSLPLLSGLALAVTLLSVKWSSGGMRLTGYLLQLYIAIAVIFSLLTQQAGSGTLLAAAIASICSACAIYHFRFCRRNPPPEHSQLFANYDQQDMSAVALLLSGLASGYAAAMFLFLMGLSSLSQDTAQTAYACIQTVTMNVSAIALMILALSRKNGELRNVAILIMIIGGGKAFLDLLSISGLALVISIFSCGVAISVISLALSRWQKQTPHQETLVAEDPVTLATENLD